VPRGLPTPAVPGIKSSDVAALLAAAGGVLLVIFSESLGAAENFATKHGYDIDPNQKLIALGVANGGSVLVVGLAAGAACPGRPSTRGPAPAPSSPHSSQPC
jgi:sulfate permease, SulP family